MQQVLPLSFIVISIFALRTYGTIRISGGSSYTYDPRNPTEILWTCNRNNDSPITWTRGDEAVVGDGLVLGNGRLRLNQNTIGTEDPQRFEGLYRCHSGGETSAPVALFVVPRRMNVNTTVQHPLEGENVTINCPLRFGSLRNNWTVTWIAEYRNEDAPPTSGLHFRTEPSFQLVINNATVNYADAKFRCRANRLGRNEVESQRITLNLYHDANVTTFPENPVVVPNGHHNGVVTFEIRAYPPPTIKLCYNGTCEFDPARRVQSTINSNGDETMYKAEFIIHNMNEYDNGNVTLRVIPERGVTFSHTVMLFLPYKIDVTMDSNIVSNSDVLLHIHLRRAIHFDYEIEFVDNDEVISTMEGEKGKETFQHTITVHRDTELMARLKIGEVRGPESDAVTIDVTEAPESESDDNTVTIVAVIATAVVLLTLIVSATLIIIMLVFRNKNKNKGNKEGTDVGDAENAKGESQIQLSTQNGRHHMTINPINQPQIAVIAATPHNMNGSFAHNVYPAAPYFPRPHYGSTSSDHSSTPSRKSSGGTGYESGLGSAVYPCGFSPYPSNHMHCSRCACNCEPDVYHGFHQHQQQQQEEPQQPVQHDHNGSAMASQQLTTSSNNNLTPARPPMRRNSSDPNISRHKPSPCRPLDEQTSNKLLSSSSVV